MRSAHAADGLTRGEAERRFREMQGRSIQEFLGHADSKTTQIYAHYAPSAHEVAMVNEAFAIETPTTLTTSPDG